MANHILMPSQISLLLLLLAACIISFAVPCSASEDNSTTAAYTVQLTPNITLRYTLNSDSSVLFDVEAVLPADTAYFGIVPAGYTQLYCQQQHPTCFLAAPLGAL